MTRLSRGSANLIPKNLSKCVNAGYTKIYLTKIQQIWGLKHIFNDRVDREDIAIIIMDTKLVPDFVLDAWCFFIAGNHPVLTPTRSASKSLTHENRAAKS